MELSPLPAVVSSPLAAASPAPLDSCAAPHWYALYTCANHEKRVALALAERHLEHYLPVYRSLRRWNDRRVELDLPLFPGYVFLRLDLREKLRALQIPGAVRLVGFDGRPAALPDDEFALLRAGLAARLAAEPCPFLTVGRRVRIASGPFAGLEGILKRKKSGLRVVVSLDLIQRSISLDLSGYDVRPVFGAASRAARTGAAR